MAGLHFFMCVKNEMDEVMCDSLVLFLSQIGVLLIEKVLREVLIFFIKLTKSSLIKIYK